MADKALFNGISVCVFTYNYESYIAQALDSILGQKINFKLEIIIGDDCSTDGTRTIAIEYQRKYPEIISLSFNSQNIGGTRNWINTMSKCSGKYISLLDGDDYFTDPFKLQKQYDHLEKNSNLVLSFHSVTEKYDNIVGIDELIEYREPVYQLAEIFKLGWFIRTSTMVFRNGILTNNPPDWIYSYPYRYDTIMHVFLGKYGDFGNIRESMSVWRKHMNGMSYTISKNLINSIQEEINLLNKLNEYTGYLFRNEVKIYSASNFTRLFLTIIKNKSVHKYPLLLMRCFFRMNHMHVLHSIKKGFNGN
jgi:glycosyltransferase involved in cell wall biosynthesis